jgi:hypothetical protein
LPQIRHSLAALSTPLLDRRAIEHLFGLGPRQANNLLRSLPGHTLGTSSVISREELLSQLDQMATPRAQAAELARHTSVLEELDRLRSAPRVRRLPAPPRPAPHRTSLPTGVRIPAPGQMTIPFTSPEELLGHLLVLAQSAAKDFAAFAAALHADDTAVAPPPSGAPNERPNKEMEQEARDG